MKKLLRSISMIMTILIIISAIALINVSATEDINEDFAEDFSSWGWIINTGYSVAEFENVDTNISVETNDEMQAYINTDYNLYIYGGTGYINFDAGGAELGKVTVNLKVKSTFSGDMGHVCVNSIKNSEIVRNKLFGIQSGTYALLGLQTTAETAPLSVKSSWGASDIGAKTYDNEGYIPIEIVFERYSKNRDWDIKVFNKAYSTSYPVITAIAPKADYPVIEGISVGTAGGKVLQIDEFNVKFGGYYSDTGDNRDDNVSAEVVFVDSSGDIHSDIVPDIGELEPKIMLTNNSSMNLRGALYLAEYDDESLKNVELEDFKMLEGEKYLAELSKIPDAVFNKNDMVLLVWSNTFTPFMKPMKVIYSGQGKRVGDGDSYWLEVNSTQKLSAEDLKVENFVITDLDGVNTKIDEVRYYFHSNRLMFRLADDGEIKESYTVMATNVNAVEGEEVNLLNQAKPIGVYDASVYETGIQSLSLIKDGEYILEAKEDGNYELEIKIITADRKENKKLTIFRQTENSIVPTEQISITDCNEQTIKINRTLYLKKGESIYAIIE